MIETIGQRMTRLMKQKGISNVEMGDLLDIDPSYVSKFKTDARRPNTYQIDKIARKLGITTDYLLGNETSGLPFYVNYLDGIKQSISISTGLSSEKHFSLYNIWSTINDVKKDDLLIFAKTTNENLNGKIVLVSHNKKELMLGRIFGTLLYFDNGSTPLELNNEQYVIEGKLIRSMRYFN